ncbi:MAG: hypothetical protein Q9204_007539 [Flavoplaca sp. TL-2023a]
MHLILLPFAYILLVLTLLSLDTSHGKVAAAPAADPQLYHHCLDPKHKFYQTCCETEQDPNCDGVHGPKNPLKPGEHDKHWEEGPPPPEPDAEPDTEEEKLHVVWNGKYVIEVTKKPS